MRGAPRDHGPFGFRCKLSFGLRRVSHQESSSDRREAFHRHLPGVTARLPEIVRRPHPQPRAGRAPSSNPKGSTVERRLSSDNLQPAGSANGRVGVQVGLAYGEQPPNAVYHDPDEGDANEGDAGSSEEAIAVNDQLNREEVEGEMTTARQAAHSTLKVPNAETRRAMAECEEMMRRGTARFASAEELFAELDKAGYQ